MVSIGSEAYGFGDADFLREATRKVSEAIAAERPDLADVSMEVAAACVLGVARSGYARDEEERIDVADLVQAALARLRAKVATQVTGEAVETLEIGTHRRVTDALFAGRSVAEVAASEPSATVAQVEAVARQVEALREMARLGEEEEEVRQAYDGAMGRTP